jgi:hypothetical protein
MPHPAESPDMAPSDFFLFGFLKKNLPEYQILATCTSSDQILSFLFDLSVDQIVCPHESI